MPLNPSGQLSLGGSVVGESIALQLDLSPTAQVSLNDAAVRAIAGIASGPISLPTDFWGKPVPVPTGTMKGIFGYGFNGTAPFFTYQSVTNLVSNTGFITADVTGVGSIRAGLAACGYGSDKAIFGYGATTTYSPRTGLTSIPTNISNKVSNTGVVATDTAGVGTARGGLAACSYGTGLGVFAYGGNATPLTIRNYISDTGVVATDTNITSTARNNPAACSYGQDKGIFGYGAIYGTGITTQFLSSTNTISNTGVFSSDVTGVGTARYGLAACGYGGDKGIFGYGFRFDPSDFYSMTNLVSNTGIVSADTTGIGTARGRLAACGYGGDKGMFGYGDSGSNVYLAVTNRISNTGVVSSDAPGIGTPRSSLAASGYSLT